MLLALLDEASGAAALARAGRQLQARRAGGLAHGEFEDGFRMDATWASAPPLDAELALAQIAPELRPLRRRLRCASGELLAAPHPGGGWMARWNGRGRAAVGGTLLDADRWTAVGALPAFVLVDGRTEELRQA